MWFDVQDKNSKKCLISFSAVYLNPNELDPCNCSCYEYEIERDLNTLVNSKELDYYV